MFNYIKDSVISFIEGNKPYLKLLRLITGRHSLKDCYIISKNYRKVVSIEQSSIEENSRICYNIMYIDKLENKTKTIILSQNDKLATVYKDDVMYEDADIIYRYVRSLITMCGGQYPKGLRVYVDITQI